MKSPQTPRHSRESSAYGSILESPSDRRQSKSSLPDFITPHRNSFAQQDALDLNTLSNTVPTGANGMGNLADELADAFSDSGAEDEDGGDDASQSDGTPSATQQLPLTKVGSEERVSRTEAELLSAGQQGHKRNVSVYDGSEYGSESDLETPGMPLSLLSKIDAINSLARRGTEDYGGPNENAFYRLTDGLRDLGSQSGVEGGASRLITAHSALTTHLAHQTRQMHTLTYALLSPLVATPESDTIDDLIPLLHGLTEEMPRPSTLAFTSLATLHAMTSDLVQTLNYLSDTLHMSRQTTSTATRKLRSAKDLVAEIRREEELREEGEVWLERGDWGKRLEQRECAGVCGEVIGGFEEVCNGWRERLIAQAEARA